MKRRPVRLPFVATAQVVTQNDGGGRNERDEAEENESGAVLDAGGVLVLRDFGGHHVDVIRQSHHPLKEKVAGFFDVPREFVAHHISGGEHDRCSLAGHAGDAQNRRGQNARRRTPSRQDGS